MRRSSLALLRQAGTTQGRGARAHCLGLVSGGDAPGRVAAVAHATLKVGAVHRAAADGQLVARGVDAPLRVLAGATPRRAVEVVAALGLVENSRDRAVGASAEGILRGHRRKPLLDHHHVGRQIGGSLHEVERAAVVCKERARHRVRRDAGRAGGGVDIARARGGRRRREGRQNEGGHHDSSIVVNLPGGSACSVQAQGGPSLREALQSPPAWWRQNFEVWAEEFLKSPVYSTLARRITPDRKSHESRVVGTLLATDKKKERNNTDDPTSGQKNSWPTSNSLALVVARDCQ